MNQLKSVQTAEVRDAALAALDEFLAEQSDILDELCAGQTRPGDLQKLFVDGEQAQRQSQLQHALDTLTQYAA